MPKIFISYQISWHSSNCALAYPRECVCFDKRKRKREIPRSHFIHHGDDIRKYKLESHAPSSLYVIFRYDMTMIVTCNLEYLSSLFIFEISSTTDNYLSYLSLSFSPWLNIIPAGYTCGRGGLFRVTSQNALNPRPRRKTPSLLLFARWMQEKRG